MYIEKEHNLVTGAQIDRLCWISSDHARLKTQGRVQIKLLTVSIPLQVSQVRCWQASALWLKSCCSYRQRHCPLLPSPHCHPHEVLTCRYSVLVTQSSRSAQPICMLTVFYTRPCMPLASTNFLGWAFPAGLQEEDFFCKVSSRDVSNEIKKCFVQSFTEKE